MDGLVAREEPLDDGLAARDGRAPPAASQLAAAGDAARDGFATAGASQRGRVDELNGSRPATFAAGNVPTVRADRDGATDRDLAEGSITVTR